MIAIELDSTQARQLQDLASAQGSDVSSLVRQVIADYLEFCAATNDPPEAWAAASVALAPEVMETESWDDAGKSEHGSR